MKKIKNHIEEMGNGNSKRLAYYIFIGVLSVFANFAMGVVDRIIESNQRTPSDVYEQVSTVVKNQDKEIDLLNKMVTSMALMNQTQTMILQQRVNP